MLPMLNKKIRNQCERTHTHGIVVQKYNRERANPAGLISAVTKYT